MLLIVSPAKTLDYETPSTIQAFTMPEFLDDSQELINTLKDLAPQDVAKLMKVSDKIAVLNATRFAQWRQPFSKGSAKQAVLAFKGDVYTGLGAESFCDKDFDFAQKHFRILSGLYGMLRPLDLMLPYRLEMGTKYKNSRGKNLYEFWSDKITDYLNKEMDAAAQEGADRVLVNLASNEYFKAVKTKMLKAQIITPVFKDLKNGQYKIISFYAKKARGMMSAYAIKNQITQAEDLKAFNIAGYYYSKELSSQSDWVFLRDHN